MEVRKEKEAREVKAVLQGNRRYIKNELIAGIISGEFSWKQKGDTKYLKEWQPNAWNHLPGTQQVAISITICQQSSSHFLKRTWARTSSTQSTLQWYLRQLHSQMIFLLNTNADNLMPDPVTAVLWCFQPARRTLSSTTTICSYGWSLTFSSCLELKANKDKREIAVDKKK